jgi:hypothetical protein
VTEILRWSPDLVYERHGLYYPAHRRLGRSVPLVTEVNGADRAEWRLKSPAKAFYNRLTRGRGLRDCSGLVFVTHELSISPDFSKAAARVPTLVLANGVRLSDAPRVPPPAADASPRLLFVGHPNTPWHGIDDVLALARARPSWSVDIVGPDRNALGGAVPTNVTCFGELGRDELAQRLASADVGIGSLALYREGITEACTLKVREYLAAGLPVVLGYDDTDFPNGAPFLLRVPNVLGGVMRSITEVEAFIARWKGLRVAATAVSHLDVTEKESERISFLREVLDRWKERRSRTSDLGR